MSTALDGWPTVRTLVGRVQPDSPAAAADLRQGDLIVGIDGEQVDSLVGLLAELRNAAPGDEVTVTSVREGEERQVQVTLGELPE